MLNNKKETKTIGQVTMKKNYKEWFNNRTGDIDSKVFIHFEIHGYTVASAIKSNDNKFVLFGDNAEKYLKLFQIVA